MRIILISLHKSALLLANESEWAEREVEVERNKVIFLQSEIFFSHTVNCFMSRKSCERY
jgi:hypothetical protein